MKLPGALNEGDTIGVVSPSSAITGKGREQLRKGIINLRKMGFEVVLGRNALRKQDGSAGPPEGRASDINDMFSDRQVKAVICSQGGYTANTCLPFLDFKAIGKNPKIFSGISDITVLLNAIHSRTGMPTFHGSDVMWGFGKPAQYETDSFISVLMQSETGRVKKNSKWHVIRPGLAEGALVGGNLNCLLKLAGTEFQPDYRNKILFLEAFDVNPDSCSYMVAQLKQTGAFENVRGVLIGYIWGLQASAKRRRGTQLERIVEKATGEFDFPIVKCDDFGHNCPNMTMPIGAKARLHAAGPDTGLELTEKCVA